MSINLNNSMDVLNIAHITLEFKLGVGGIKSVTTGLIPALPKKGINPSVITPFYDVYNNFYDKDNLQKVATVTHIYKGKEFQSDVWRACTYVIDGKEIYHYLIKPVANSQVSRIFEVGNEKDMYMCFPHSESQNRVEYFNSAVATMLRMPNDIPEFDIIHCHTWHTGLTACLVKEFENLLPYQKLIQAEPLNLKKIPYVVSTIHMLLKGQNGGIYSKEAIAKFLHSIGLPKDFSEKFPHRHEDINPNHLKQVSLALAYSDQVNTVSHGLVAEAINGKGEGIDDILQQLHAQGRLIGITNGINFNDFDATNPSNLHEYTLDINNIRLGKQKLKNHLEKHYPKLDANKKWFIFIGRFANEKGVDYLQDLAAAVKKVNGNLIVLGSHVVTTIKDGKVVPRYQEEIDRLKSNKDVVVIDNAAEQKEFGKKFRAACDCAVSLSKNEACGLIPMELMACGAPSVVPNIQGLPDTVKKLIIDYLIKKGYSGTGMLYDGNPENRTAHLEKAISDTVDFLNTLADRELLNTFMAELIINARQFDWANNPAEEYASLYKNLSNRELLTFDKVRNIPKPVAPLLPTFNTTKNKTAPNIINAIKQPVKIWQIGFNKAGSTTFFKFFIKNKIPSVHYGLKNKPIADYMYANYKNDRPLVEGEFDKYTAYFDMENIYYENPLYIGQSFFKELDAQYPGSKFILNTRDKQEWIKSRLLHEDPNKHLMYIDVMQEQYKMSRDEVIEKWSRDWDEHHAAVLEYFKDRPQDLLIFDIKKDSPVKIREFFKDYFDLDVSLYEIYNQTNVIKPVFTP